MREDRGIIYILLLGNRVMYVGQTIAFEKRMESHAQSKVFDNVYMKFVDRVDLDKEEKAAVLKYKPALNVLLIDNAHLSFEERLEEATITRDTDFSDFYTDTLDDWDMPKWKNPSFCIGYRKINADSTIWEIEKAMDLTFGDDPEGWAFLEWVLDQKAPIYRPHKYEAAIREMIKVNAQGLHY